MARKKHLIIGCGAAGLSALKQIRKSGSEDEVKLVTMENHWPYSPMSLPYLISGRRKKEEIVIADEDFFKKNEAELVKGVRVDKIDPRDKRVIYDQGGSESYDTLLIASGSTPIIDPIPAASGVSGFHVLDDLSELEQHEPGSHITILGAGFVGMELAVSLKEAGFSATVIAPRERILRPYFDPELDDMFIDLFKEHGLPLELNWGTAAEISRNGAAKVTFNSGKAMETSLVIAATGVAPRLSFLKDSGIAVNQGVMVDRSMKSNFPDILAAGDVAETARYGSNQNGLSLTWPAAIQQGRVAGDAMLGKPAEYEGWLPMNAFNFFGCYAVSLGEFMGRPGDDSLVYKDESNRKYAKIVCRDNCLIGANFFNVDVDGGVLLNLIKNRIDVGKHKQLLLHHPKDAALWLAG